MSDVLRWVVPVPLALAVLVMQLPTQGVANATTTELDSGQSASKAINPGEVRVANQRKFGGTSYSGTSNSGTSNSGTSNRGTRNTGTNSGEGTGHRFVDNRFNKRNVSGGNGSSGNGEIATSKSGSGKFSTKKVESTNKENIGQSGTGKTGNAGSSKISTGTNSTSGTIGKNAMGPAGKTGSGGSEPVSPPSGSNGGTSGKIGMGPALTGSGGSNPGSLPSSSNGGTNGKIGTGPALTGSGANTLTSTRSLKGNGPFGINMPGNGVTTTTDKATGATTTTTKLGGVVVSTTSKLGPITTTVNNVTGVTTQTNSDTGATIKTSGSVTFPVGAANGSTNGPKGTTNIGNPVLVPITEPSIPLNSNTGSTTTSNNNTVVTTTTGKAGSGGTGAGTGGTTTKGGGTTTAGSGTTTASGTGTGGTTSKGGSGGTGTGTTTTAGGLGGKTGQGGNGGQGGKGGMGPVAGVMVGTGSGPFTDLTPINNQSVTIFRGPRHVWIGGVERSFVAASVLPGLYLGSDYYAPQGYIAVAHPACYGKTVEGCLLRWQQVPLESGGSDVQCVQLCRSSGGGLAPGPAAQQIAAAAQALASEPMAPAPAQVQTAGGCEVAIYADANFAGQATSTVENQPRLGDVGWKGEIASVQVKGGTWDFFSGDDYGGQTMRLSPGEYGQLGPQWTKHISSFMCLGQQ
jgi:Beta/Gamma crystallin